MESNTKGGLTSKEGRRFAFTLAAAFAVIALIAGWRERETLSRAASVLAMLFLIAGVIVPTRLGPVERMWMKFGLLLSKITSPVFLGLVYFVVFTPAGLLRRALGKNAVNHSLVDDSYWRVRPKVDPGIRRKSMERQF